MAENRCSCSQGTASSSGRDSVVIDTMRVLDSCRDRDCYEDVRVYLTPTGRELINHTSTVRAVDAKIIGTAISVDEVPFNCGFYQIRIRFYIRLKNEACVCAGTTRDFYSLAVVEKSVVLYGGEGSTTVFRSSHTGGFCCTGCVGEGSANAPIASVETATPVILAGRVVCCEANGGASCGCGCGCSCECHNACSCEVSGSIPAAITEQFGECLALSGEDGGNRFFVSIGIFSVVRLERPAQYLISAAEYSVPDKECHPAVSEENPCCLFRTMAFPIGAFGQSCSANENKRCR